jgi:hypothetical protein
MIVFFKKHRFCRIEQGRQTNFVQEFSLVRHYNILWMSENEEDNLEIISLPILLIFFN